MKYKEIQGDLIELAKDGYFDVIVHGCNCFCTMKAGIAPKITKEFGADRFPLEDLDYKGDINKLGEIDYETDYLIDSEGYITNKTLTVVNAYTQYRYGKNHKDGVIKPLDYEALTLCLRKLNHIFSEQHIGLPKIGCGLAGGNWNIVKKIIQEELVNCNVTIVIYNKLI